MIKTFIKRNNYIDKIKPFVDKDIIKVLIGQRRVGKSYLLLQIIDYLKSNGVTEKKIIYLNKEDIKWDFVKDYKNLYEQVKDFKYIFIDEVQDVQDWEKAIRSLQANGNYDIYITGSNSNLLSGELATFLSGRYISFDIYPLNYKEFLQFHNLKNTEKSFYKYLQFGGLPYLKNLVLEEEVVNPYLKDVVNTIILKDVISKFKIRNVDFLKKLISYLAKQIGNIFSAKKISDYLKSQQVNISPNIVLDYIDYSLQSLILNEVKRYDIKGKKTFEIKQKYYFTDIGLRNVLAGGFTTLDIAGILENIVFINLVSAGYKLAIGEINKKEIDFIAEKDDKKIYIQVTYLLESKETIDREFGVFDGVKDNWPKYVLSLDKKAGGYINGIEHKNLIDFIYELHI